MRPSIGDVERSGDRSTTSGRETAPQQDVTAPQQDVTAPQHDVTAPQHDVTAPQHDVTAPQHGSACPYSFSGSSFFTGSFSGERASLRLIGTGGFLLACCIFRFDLSPKMRLNSKSA